MTDENKKIIKQSFESLQILGVCPDFTLMSTTDPEYNIKYIKALNWANYCLEDEDLKEETIKYFKINNKDTDIIEQAKPWRFNIVGKLCWLINNNCPLKESSIKFLEDNIKKLEENSIEDALTECNDVLSTKLKKSEIKEILTKDRIELAISTIDNEIDKMIYNGEEIDIYSKLIELDVDSVLSRTLKEHYHEVLSSLVSELDDVKREVFVITEEETPTKILTLEEKEQYIEELTKHLSSVRNCQHQIQIYLGNNKAKRNDIRVTNKVTQARIEKSVKDVRFKAYDNILKVQSIPLDRIVGTQLLLTYNSFNRNLCLYYALNDEGLNVKGTTIQNYDETKSVQKKLREPEKILSHLQQNSDKRAKIVFDGLSTKAQELNGRLNEHTILLKAFKKLIKE